jgi:predicted RNA-binding Zn-ribbon protein involved in translation (DUF1610 family)
MNPTPINESESWESVHICPKCGHVINLADIDLKAIATEIVECPRCEWIGPIEIEIADPEQGPA